MTSTRSQFDADRFEEPESISFVKTAATPHEVSCQLCARTLFIDDETLASVNRQIERGLDEPAFTCDECILIEEDNEQRQ